MSTTAHKASILIVDDTPENLQLLSSMLTEAGYRVRPVISGAMALQSVYAEQPDLVLLDVNMPEMDGYEVCERFKADPLLVNIPILFISALDSTFNKVRAFEVGGVDYITKPFQFEEVLARVEAQLNLYQQRREIEHLREQDRIYFQKLSQMKDDVVRMTTHNLKNPLNTLINATYLLNQSEIVNDEQERQKYLKLLKNNADRVLDLITDLLELARIETGMALTKEIMLLPNFLERNIENFERLASNKRITLELGPVESYFTVPFDPELINQVLQILLDNAIKHTPEGGKVQIEASLMHREVLIRVIDTGRTIPKEDLPNLFDKFYPSNRGLPDGEEGTGLELSIAKSIVEQHGGRIWAESEEELGNVFYIVLPRD